LQGACVEYRKALRYCPRDYDVHLALADVLSDLANRAKGRDRVRPATEAIEHYTEFLEHGDKRPMSVDMYVVCRKLAQCYFQRGNFQNSGKDLEMSVFYSNEALKIRPGDRDVLRNIEIAEKIRQERCV
jgi:tetratricopeptide (TPR) repeat protein